MPFQISKCWPNSFRENSEVTKIWKKKTKTKTKKKKKKNQIWLKIGEHEYIYIAEIKFEKKNNSIY